MIHAFDWSTDLIPFIVFLSYETTFVRIRFVDVDNEAANFTVNEEHYSYISKHDKSFVHLVALYVDIF